MLCLLSLWRPEIVVQKAAVPAETNVLEPLQTVFRSIMGGGDSSLTGNPLLQSVQGRFYTPSSFTLKMLEHYNRSVCSWSPPVPYSQTARKFLQKCNLNLFLVSPGPLNEFITNKVNPALINMDGAVSSTVPKDHSVDQKPSKLKSTLDEVLRSLKRPPDSDQHGVYCLCPKGGKKVYVVLSERELDSLQLNALMCSLKRLYHKEDNHLLIFCVLSRDRRSNISQK